MQVPLLQSTKSQMLNGGGLGLGEMVKIGEDIEVIGTSQNMPVYPRKHSHVTKSPSSSMHKPFVQLTKLHTEIFTVGVGETRIELEKGGRLVVALKKITEEGGEIVEGGGKDSELGLNSREVKVNEGEGVVEKEGRLGVALETIIEDGSEVVEGSGNVSELESKGLNFEETEVEGVSENSELETEKANVVDTEVREGVGVRKGSSRLSELEEKTKRNDEKVEIGSDIVGVGVVTRDEVVMTTSQKSPVYPAKHWQVKSSPKLSATQVPLLQSMRSQIGTGGLGVGMRVNVADSIGKSQNSPVYPGKQ